MVMHIIDSSVGIGGDYDPRVGKLVVRPSVPIGIVGIVPEQDIPRYGEVPCGQETVR
jgi:hypothetical protein